ncbi:hypothetical protein B296_00007801 [Ensete ventricosum]|uniref:Uncharacterized protein n=1 Tax=Ensete ventricosum TaxID=4639 RepID=A0A426Z4R3_ENSVE|nr:hypothetical protein B296_00007801 [Ensete ventricosum]
MPFPTYFALRKSYDLSFTKKCDGYKFCTKSHAKSSFDRFFVHHLKFTTLAIPNVLAHGKSYEHGFMKKHGGHKLCVKSCAESSFDRFFVHRLRNLKY